MVIKIMVDIAIAVNSSRPIVHNEEDQYQYEKQRQQLVTPT